MEANVIIRETSTTLSFARLARVFSDSQSELSESADVDGRFKPCGHLPGTGFSHNLVILPMLLCMLSRDDARSQLL